MPKRSRDARPAPLDRPVHVAHHEGVADADHAHAALAHLARPLDLDPQLRGGDPAGAGDAADPVGGLLVAAVAHVEHPAERVLVEGVLALVHRVPGGRGHRAALVGVVGHDADVLLRDLADHGLLAHERLGHERGALDHLAHVVGERLGEAGADARGGREADVAAAAADDHVAAHVEQPDEGVHAGHGDDARGLVDFLRGQVREPAQPRKPLPRPQLAVQVVGVHLRVEIAHLEAGHPVLLGDAPHHVHEQAHPAVAAGVPGRADDERDPAPARGRQEELDLLLGEVAHADVLAEVDRARVGAAPVGHEVVRAAFHAAVKALGGRRGRAEVPG